MTAVALESTAVPGLGFPLREREASTAAGLALINLKLHEIVRVLITRLL